MKNWIVYPKLNQENKWYQNKNNKWSYLKLLIKNAYWNSEECQKFLTALLRLRKYMRKDFNPKTKKLTPWLKSPYRVSLNCLVKNDQGRLLSVRPKVLVKNKLIKFVKTLLSRLFLTCPHKRVFSLVLYMNRLFLIVNLTKSMSLWLPQVKTLMMITMIMMIIMTICAKKIKRLCRSIINISRNQKLERCVVKEMLLFFRLKKVEKIWSNLLRIKRCLI